MKFSFYMLIHLKRLSIILIFCFIKKMVWDVIGSSNLLNNIFKMFIFYDVFFFVSYAFLQIPFDSIKLYVLYVTFSKC